MERYNFSFHLLLRTVASTQVENLLLIATFLIYSYLDFFRKRTNAKPVNEMLVMKVMVRFKLLKQTKFLSNNIAKRLCNFTAS